MRAKKREDKPDNKMTTNIFGKELESLINRYSKEKESNTPDFILAQYLKDCLDSFNKAVQRREGWYGRIDAENG